MVKCPLCLGDGYVNIEVYRVRRYIDLCPVCLGNGSINVVNIEE